MSTGKIFKTITKVICIFVDVGTVFFPKSEWTELESLVPSSYYQTILKTDDLYNNPSFLNQVITIALKNLRLFVQTLYARQNYLNLYSLCSCTDRDADTEVLPFLWGHKIDSKTPVEALAKIQAEGLAFSKKMSEAVNVISQKCPLSQQCLTNYNDKFMDILSGRQDSMILETIWQQYLPQYYPKIFQPLIRYERARPFEKYFGEFLKLFSSTSSIYFNPARFSGYDFFTPYDSAYPFFQKENLANPFYYNTRFPGNLKMNSFDKFYPVSERYNLNPNHYNNFGYGFQPNSFNNFYEPNPYTGYKVFNNYDFDLFPFGYNGLNEKYQDGTFKISKINNAYDKITYGTSGESSGTVLTTTFGGHVPVDVAETSSSSSSIPLDHFYVDPFFTRSQIIYDKTQELAYPYHSLFTRSVDEPTTTTDSTETTSTTGTTETSSTAAPTEATTESS